MYAPPHKVYQVREGLPALQIYSPGLPLGIQCLRQKTSSRGRILRSLPRSLRYSLPLEGRADALHCPQREGPGGDPSTQRHGGPPPVGGDGLLDPAGQDGLERESVPRVPLLPPLHWPQSLGILHHIHRPPLLPHHRHSRRQVVHREQDEGQQTVHLATLSGEHQYSVSLGGLRSVEGQCEGVQGEEEEGPERDVLVTDGQLGIPLSDAGPSHIHR